LSADRRCCSAHQRWRSSRTAAGFPSSCRTFGAKHLRTSWSAPKLCWRSWEVVPGAGLGAAFRELRGPPRRRPQPGPIAALGLAPEERPRWISRPRAAGADREEQDQSRKLPRSRRIPAVRETGVEHELTPGRRR
jgi:hypothetical protein